MESDEPEFVEQQDQPPEARETEENIDIEADDANAKPPDVQTEPFCTESKLVNSQDASNENETDPSDEPQQIDDELERQLQAKLTAPMREIMGGVDARNIVSGRRKRKTRQDDDYAAYRTLIDEEDTPAILQGFADVQYVENPNIRYHRDDLPEPSGPITTPLIADGLENRIAFYFNYRIIEPLDCPRIHQLDMSCDGAFREWPTELPRILSQDLPQCEIFIDSILTSVFFNNC